jgi:hypothetical protein
MNYDWDLRTSQVSVVNEHDDYGMAVKMKDPKKQPKNYQYNTEEKHKKH